MVMNSKYRKNTKIFARKYLYSCFSPLTMNFKNSTISMISMTHSASASTDKPMFKIICNTFGINSLNGFGLVKRFNVRTSKRYISRLFYHLRHVKYVSDYYFKKFILSSAVNTLAMIIQRLTLKCRSLITCM